MGPMSPMGPIGPLYRTDGYFGRDTLFSTVRGHEHQGVAGDPVPYTIRGDNLFTALLLLSFIVLTVSVSRIRGFLFLQLKNLLFPTAAAHDVHQTLRETAFQTFIVGLLCLSLSLATYIYTVRNVADVFRIENYQLVLLLLACFLGYFCLKFFSYERINCVFFTKSQVFFWQHTILFLYSMEGILFFPVVLLQVYFDLALEKAVAYYIFVVFFIKILSFYKSWNIFFRQFGSFYQNILYFCTLEIAPLLMLAGGIRQLIDCLKITF